MAFTIHSGETVNGSSRRPTSIEVNEIGIAVGAFKRVMNPWSEVMSIEIFGPDSQTSRVTATRLAALGILAFAFKKSTTETLVVVSYKSGKTQNLMFLKKSEPEVRALFSPFISCVSNDSLTVRDDKAPNVAITSRSSMVSKTTEIRELADLFEKGLIDESEFKNLKASVINRSEESEMFVTTVDTNETGSGVPEEDMSDEEELEELEEFDSNGTANVVLETLVSGKTFIYKVSGWSEQDVEELANEIGFFMFDTFFFPQKVLRRARRELKINNSINFEYPLLNDQLLDTLVNRFHCNVEIEYKPATALNFQSREDARVNRKIIDVAPFRELMADVFYVSVGIHEENLNHRKDAWDLFLKHRLNVESLQVLNVPGFFHDAFELPLGVPLIDMKESKSDVMIRKLEQIGFRAERFWVKSTM